MATLTIPFPDFQNGAPIIAAQNNSNNAAIANFTNGLSAGLNFDSGAIGTASIAAQAIGTAQLADSAVTSIKLAASLTLTTPVLGVASATSLAVSGSVSVVGNVVYHIAINNQTTAYTLTLADDGKIVEVLSATAVNVTIPLESSVAFPIGTQITVIQTGAGQLTFVPTGGVTLNGNPGVKTRGQWTAGTLIKRAANTWILLGDLSA